MTIIEAAKAIRMEVERLARVNDALEQGKDPAQVAEMRANALAISELVTRLFNLPAR